MFILINKWDETVEDEDDEDAENQDEVYNKCDNSSKYIQFVKLCLQLGHLLRMIGLFRHNSLMATLDNIYITMF